MTKPQLHWYLEMILHAFLELSGRRGISMAVLPISVADIEAYARIFEWAEDLEFFCKCVFALDDEYLKINADKKKAEAEQMPLKKKT